MEYKAQNHGVGISLLGMGTMRLPLLEKGNNKAIDYEHAQRMVDTAYASGVTYYDTAYMYHDGESEKFVGQALKKYPRDSFLVADKLPIWMCEKKEDMQRIFSDQQQKTGFDFFDYYLLHSLNLELYEKCEAFGAYDFVRQKQREGKVGKIGFSFHGTVETLKRMISEHEWDFAQIQLNYLDWEDQDAKTQYEILTQAGIPVIIMEPVRGGKLAKPGRRAEVILKAAQPQKSIASWAIRFAADLPNVMTVLSGMSNEEQLTDNLSLFAPFESLTQEERKVIEQVCAVMREKNPIPCTGCDYCADCPQKIKISSIFRLYNSVVNEEIKKKQALALYAQLETKAENCIGCGKCKGHCPQSIEIPDLLKGDVGEFFAD